MVMHGEAVRFLRRLPLLAGLPASDLEQMAARARRRAVPAGRVVMEEGAPADGLYVLVHGRIEVTKRDGGEELVLARHGPGAFVGEMALLEDTVRTATVRALRASEFLILDPVDFDALLAASPTAARTVLRAIGRRLAGMEAAVLQREKLASLGVLAAGLAHELNNPAAAARSAARQLESAVRRLEQLSLEIGGRAALVSIASRAADTIRAQTAVVPPADAVAALTDTLRQHGATAPQTGAHALASCGIDAGILADWTGTLDAAEKRLLLDWLAVRCDVESLTREVAAAADAIAGVVAAVRTHVDLDRAPLGDTDVRQSIDAALVVLRSRWKRGVKVSLDIPPDLPPIEARAGELSQVWSNLIGNAIDAMGGAGHLLIRARHAGGRIAICVEDDGPGIPPSLRRRIFEPFFTTKEAGAGSGLGLHIVRSIVVHRHGGRIDVRSRPGRTRFRVLLPMRRRARAAAEAS
jgi:signal transduction histidine kinase